MIRCDIDKLEKMMHDLEPKRRMQAVKGAFRKAANKVRKQAVSNLREKRSQILSSREKANRRVDPGKNPNPELEKGIRALVYKRKTGFRVTVGTKKANKKGLGEKGFHTNRRELKKPEEERRKLPILLWAETGTKERHTKTRTKIFRRKKKGHYTGRMPTMGFMDKTRKEVEEKVTDDLKNAIEENIIKTARKYGTR